MSDESDYQSSSDEEAIFSEALGFNPGPERQAYLDRVCRINFPLRKQVEELLRAHDVLDKLGEQPGDRLGNFVLVERIGKGGFGCVWKAKQEQPIRREVALKIINLGMDNRQVIVRFNAERQALAMMEHENIAKIFDAGESAQGRPFFAMELVRGPKITDYCDQHHLSTEARLRLFMQVCQAVRHAHDKGVVHRDIKPSNILVTEQHGVPSAKIIDFGVAKATGVKLTEDTLLTSDGQIIGTPSYMSPEQTGMKGLEIDNRSDIYSLGALLYELLIGRPPVTLEEFQRMYFDEIVRTIRKKDPPRPSERLAALSPQELAAVAQRRQTDSAQLHKALHRGLDWVVLRCLEKDRDRRYQNASELADRLQRHLENKPAPDNIYKIQTWIRRHKLALGIGGVFLVILAALLRWQEAKPPRWQTLPIKVNGHDQDPNWRWCFIELSGNEGWLGGGFDMQNAEEQFIGHGLLLHTRDGGQNWEQIALTNSDAGAGTVSHFNEKTWAGIAQIYDLDVMPDTKADGSRVTNIWIASFSGIFSSTNALSPNPQWKRMTPSPSDPGGYSHFFGMIPLENGYEFYVYGHQGIAHWKRGEQWKVQLTTLFYSIQGLCVLDGPNNDAWAVGGGGGGEATRGTYADFGAIWHLNGPGGVWERVSLPNVHFQEVQGLHSIINIRNSAGLIVVGDKGIILRSTKGGTNRVWEHSEPVKKDLSYIAYDRDGVLWVVGKKGTILKSSNDGATWTVYPCLDSDGKPIKANLSRLTFDDSGHAWLIADERLLKCDLR